MHPELGDIAWIAFDLVKGSEQAGRRPGLILTPRWYHERCNRAIVCPITSREGAWSFNVPLPSGLKTYGAVLVDQVRTIDRANRMFAVIERAPPELLAEVRGRLGLLLGFDIAYSIAGPQ